MKWAIGTVNTALEARVVAAAEAVLAERDVVSAADVFERIGWLAHARREEWQQGRLECLERGIPTDPGKVASALATFGRWAQARELSPIEAEPFSRTADRRPLCFSESGDTETERAYRLHWLSPELSAKKQQQVREQVTRPPDLVVTSALHDWSCGQCGMSGDFLVMDASGPLCRPCAGLGHLVFVAAGDATLSQRAKKASSLSAVVMRFSRSRKRYERQGILVEQAALAAAMASSGDVRQVGL